MSPPSPPSPWGEEADGLATRSWALRVRFTDGVVDQFDGEQRMKFSLKRLVHLITTHADTPLEEAERGIVEALNAWRQEGDQIDDMLMLAVEPVAAWHHSLVDAEAVAA